MAFLDNSGDIILDAVLTDLGRKTLSKGDGSFQITKFALGDEEIDYALYNASHASGSSYYDIQILQTPVLEAFTNNASSMKSNLVSYASLNLLYLPVIKLNQTSTSTKMHVSGTFMVAVDQATEGSNSTDGTMPNAVAYNSNVAVQGFIMGESLNGGTHIRLDQGLDTTEISPSQGLSADLVEDAYIIQIDNRLGRIVTEDGVRISPDYLDDDNIAFYTVDRADGVVDNGVNTNDPSQTIAGPRGTMFKFKIASSLDLMTSTYLFTQLGGTTTMINNGGTSQNVRYIDALVRATGVKTGYSIDIPVRYIKTIVS
tara:strand:- start:6 stop:947 length:942 start_codon:yes stop_codon:yes gene_type:complete